MADRASLEVLGLILGCVTALVIGIAVLAVRSHINTAAANQTAPVATVNPAAPIVPVALSPRR